MLCIIMYKHKDDKYKFADQLGVIHKGYPIFLGHILTFPPTHIRFFPIVMLFLE